MTYIRKTKEKTKQKTLWLTAEERKLLDTLSEQIGLNHSDIFRQSLREYADRRLNKSNSIFVG